jgi:hypothetical protein
MSRHCRTALVDRDWLVIAPAVHSCSLATGHLHKEELYEHTTGCGTHATGERLAGTAQDDDRCTDRQCAGAHISADR